MASISVAGRVTRDPEIRYLESGTQLCRFSVADSAYVKPEKGQEKAPGQFYDVTVWGKYAEMVGDRLVKGSRVAVSGTAVWGEYSKDGQTRKTFQITNPSVTFLDSKAEKEALQGSAGSDPFGGGAVDDAPF